MKWWEGPIAVFDTESTGVDVENDRIVTACLALLKPDGQVTNRWETLLNPGVEIPEEATAVHGISNEKAQKEGGDPATVIPILVERLNEAVSMGLPVVAFNGRFDFTLLDREVRRHCGMGLEFVLSGPLHVIDPYVMDKAVDTYRRGSRKLGDTCKLYGVELDDWHNATADAVAAGRLTQAMVKKHRGLQLPLPQLYRAQEIWARQQADSLERYLRKKNPKAAVDREWPVIPFKEI